MSLVGVVFVGLALVAVLILGGVAGDLVARDPGYVLLTYDGMAVETSLWVAVAALVVGFLLLWVVWFLAIRLLRSWGMLGRWSSNRRTRAAATRTTQGLLLMAEGQWAQAQRALVAAAPNAQAPIVNYLTAARAAAAQDLSEQRDELLVRAQETTPGSALAVGLVQAELQQQAGEWAASLTLLNDMRKAAPRHPGVQRLYLRTLQQLGRHDDLLAALDGARKSKALSKAEIAEIEAAAFAAKLTAANSVADLLAEFDNIPKGYRTNPVVAVSLGRQAVLLQKTAEQSQQQDALSDLAEPGLRAAIDKVGTGAGSDQLLSLYGQLQGAVRDRQQALQRWHKKMPQHSGVLLAGAQVAATQGDLAGAQAQLSEALAAQGSASAHVQMAQLCCAQGDAQGALEHLSQLAQWDPKMNSNAGSADLTMLALTSLEAEPGEAVDEATAATGHESDDKPLNEAGAAAS